MSADDTPDQYRLGSVDRAVQILGALAIRPGMRLGELGKALDANASTVLRTLRVLERHGLVRRGTNDVDYLLGTRLVELGQAAIASIDIVQELRPIGIRLSQEYGATAHFGMLRGGMITIVGKVDPLDPTVRYSSVGTRMPLHATAAGKAALALSGIPIPTDDLRPYTPRSHGDAESVARDVEQTRARRFSIEREEYHTGFACVGTAVRADEEVYTISISGETVPDDALTARGERLRDEVDRFLAVCAGAVVGL